MEIKNSKRFVIGILLGAVALVGVLLVFRNQVIQGPGALSAKVKVDVLLKKEIENALAEYHKQCGRYPTTNESLDVLAKAGAEAGCEKITAPLLKKVPKDSWGNSFFYHSDGVGYSLRGWGSDGAPGGEGEAQDI